MIRALAGLLGAVLVAVPLLTAPVVPVALVAAVAGVVTATGVAFLRPSVCTAGAGLAIVEYAIALALSGESTDTLAAITLGVALLLFLMVVDFGAQFCGVALDQRALSGQIRHWVGWAVVAAPASAALASAGPMTIALPAWADIVAAALGIVAAFVALVRLAIVVTARDDGAPGRRSRLMSGDETAPTWRQ